MVQTWYQSMVRHCLQICMLYLWDICTIYREIFERLLFSDISKHIASTKIEIIENKKCGTSYHCLSLQQYKNKTLKFNLSMVTRKLMVLLYSVLMSTCDSLEKGTCMQFIRSVHHEKIQCCSSTFLMVRMIQLLSCCGQII